MDASYTLEISLKHRVPLDDGDPYNEIVQRYRAQILCQHGEQETVAGTFDFYVANVALATNSGIDMVDVADSLDQDLLEYCSALFEPGTASELREDVAAQFDYPSGSRVLMLHLAKVQPEFRGKHLALVAAHKIIEQFGDGFVVALAQPLQHHESFARDAAMQYGTFEADEKLAMKRLTKHWRRLGFEPIAKTRMLGLSTGNVHPVPKLKVDAPARTARRKAKVKRT